MNKLNTTGQNVNDAAQQDAMRCTMHHFCDSPAKISDLNIITRTHQIKKNWPTILKAFKVMKIKERLKKYYFKLGHDN